LREAEQVTLTISDPTAGRSQRGDFAPRQGGHRRGLEGRAEVWLSSLL